LLGIVFTGGEGPPARFIKRLVEQEAEGALLVAADSGLTAAESSGLRPGWIIGDMDYVNAARLEAYPPERVIRHKPDKDYTDTELALRAVVEKGCDEIWILGGGRGRIDHLFAIRSLFERDVFPYRWITEAADIYCIDANMHRNTLSRRVEKDIPVSVFPLGSGPWEAESGGLKWPLEGLPWDRGFFGLSNTAPEGEFFIKTGKGRFMVILPLPSL
jgi:thiamine pyrophosphokinase